MSRGRYFRNDRYGGIGLNFPSEKDLRIGELPRINNGASDGQRGQQRDAQYDGPFRRNGIE